MILSGWETSLTVGGVADYHLTMEKTFMRRKGFIVVSLLAAGLMLTGCTESTRQIDPIKTGSFSIEGTSWRGFCQGPNLLIYVPSRDDSYADELEAVIYEDFRCVSKLNRSEDSSSKPSTDPDGIVDDEDK